jgi:hypothetical protein
MDFGSLFLLFYISFHLVSRFGVCRSSTTLVCSFVSLVSSIYHHVQCIWLIFSF